MQPTDSRAIGKNTIAILIIVAAVIAVIAATIKLDAAVAAAPASISASASAADLPVLAIVKTNNGFVVPETVPAGRYAVRLQNRTEHPAVADLMLLPYGKGIDEVQAIYGAGVQSVVQAWFGAIVFAGGPTAPAHGEGMTVVDLSAGEWTVATFGAGSLSPAATVIVTPSAESVSTVTESAVVAVSADQPVAPAAVPAGTRLWRIENTGTAPVSVGLVKLADPGLGNEATAGSARVGTGIISPGRTVWLSVAVEPGTYVVRSVPVASAGAGSVESEALAIVTAA